MPPLGSPMQRDAASSGLREIVILSLRTGLAKQGNTKVNYGKRAFTTRAAQNVRCQYLVVRDTGRNLSCPLPNWCSGWCPEPQHFGALVFHPGRVAAKGQEGGKTMSIIRYKGGAAFEARCACCGRFVKPAKEIKINEVRGLHPGPNATCSKCGRTRMLFFGFL